MGFAGETLSPGFCLQRSSQVANAVRQHTMLGRLVYLLVLVSVLIHAKLDENYFLKSCDRLEHLNWVI